jgi:hypothetical protein
VVSAWLRQSRVRTAGNNYTHCGVFIFMAFRKLFPATTWCLGRMASRPAHRAYACVFVLAFIWAAVTFVHLRRSKAQAQKLIQALELLDVGSSSNADVQRISKEFSQYEVASEDRYGVHEVNFEIAETSVVRHVVHSGAILHAGIDTRDGKVVAVGVMFERQVSGGKLAAIISEAREQSGTCQNPYCVGNPIGKRFVFSRLDMRATPEQKRRAFDLNLNWLIRFNGEARICDFSPRAWEEWKVQHPGDVPLLRSTYQCP